MYIYSAYNLVLQSEFEIPEFTRCSNSKIDVVIKRGIVPEKLSGNPVGRANWQAVTDHFLMDVPSAGRFLVQNGNEIIVSPRADADQAEINLFLCGTMLAALLQQRHHLTLHSSSILGQHGAVLFVGTSGVGKSTTLAAMVRQGHKMVSDDVTALRENSAGQIEAVPAVPKNRLWNDSAEILGHNVTDMDTIRPDIVKFNLPVENFHSAPCPVSHIFILTTSPDDDLGITSLKDSDAHQLLRKYTYRKRFLHGMGLQKFHFKFVSRLVREVPVSLVSRPLNKGFQLDRFTSAIENRLQVKSG